MSTMESLPATELVSVTIEGPICYIELNREDKYNAMNVQMITELCEIFEWTAERSEAFVTDAHGRDHNTIAEMGFDNFVAPVQNDKSTYAYA